MRAAKYLITAFILIFISSPLFAEEDGAMRISLIQGDVQIYDQGVSDWTAASVNFPLLDGDRIWVPDDARTEVQIRGGVYVRADERTAVDILSLGDDSVQFYLDRGHLYINNRRGGLQIAQVDIPVASVRAYDNSIVMLDVDESGMTEVSVLKGYAIAETRSGSTRINAGSTLTVHDDSTAVMALLGSPDEWERWNTDRDRQLIAYGESSRYLPDEIKEYSSDLDSTGTWSYEREYGYVWSPSVAVVDWAPYTAGTWIWVRNNYVWISYESWGWVPYHYGRWANIQGRGWCWVPPAAGSVYWGPGFVGWVVTPTYVAWVPLAPGETYYGYGHYGPQSVNISINKVVVRNTFVNSRHEHAVTIVERKSFGTGHRVPTRISENPFLHPERQKFETVPPRFKPEKRVLISQPPHEFERDHRHEPVMRPPDTHRQVPPAPQHTVVTPEKRISTPFITRMPQEKQPPDRVKQTRPEEIRNQRKLVRDHNASVFRREGPQELPIKTSREPREIVRKQRHIPSQQNQHGNKHQSDEGKPK